MIIRKTGKGHGPGVALREQVRNVIAVNPRPRGKGSAGLIGWGGYGAEDQGERYNRRQTTDDRKQETGGRRQRSEGIVLPTFMSFQRRHGSIGSTRRRQEEDG
jgi:hypothetical protein